VALISLAAHQGYVRLGHTAHEAVHTIPIRWAGISCLTNVTLVGMRCPGAREWLSCLKSDDLGGG
jgi:hypothetical protein